jgi:hypothetical protein
MLDSSADVSILRMCLGQLFVSLSSLLLVLVRKTELQEPVQKHDRLFKFTKLFMDQTYPLVALCLFVFVISSLRSVKTLLEVLQ